MDIKTKAAIRKNLAEYNELIETIAKIEFKKLSSSYLIDFSELVNIGTQVVHHFCTTTDITNYNNSYISTAIKWAIRNEVRRRYKWYSQKTKKDSQLNLTDEEAEVATNDIREAVYKTILSIEEMAEAENPTQIKDETKTPDEVRPLLKGYKGRVCTIDAKKVSEETLGKYFPNTPMLAAIVKVSGIMDEQVFLDDMVESFKHKFAKKPEVIDGNMAALRMALNEIKE